jgi:hypothetical protein
MALIAGIFGRTLRSARRTPTARRDGVATLHAVISKRPVLRHRNCAFQRRFSGHLRAFSQGARKCLSTKGVASSPRGMFQTSGASGGAEALAGRIGERNMAVGRQHGRCPGVGGALRAAIEQEAGLAAPGRDVVALRFLPRGRVARDSVHITSATVDRAAR